MYRSQEGVLGIVITGIVLTGIIIAIFNFFLTKAHLQKELEWFQERSAEANARYEAEQKKIEERTKIYGRYISDEELQCKDFCQPTIYLYQPSSDVKQMLCQCKKIFMRGTKE